MKSFYFEDTRTGKRRNTGVHADSAAAARKKLRRPPAEFAKLYATRGGASGSGAWDRTRADGKSPAASKLGKGRGFGPKRGPKRG